MREACRNDFARGLSLQSVIADLERGIHCFLQVAAFQYASVLFNMMSPHSGEVVCLQFQPNRFLVDQPLVAPRPRGFERTVPAQYVLDVVGNFVSNHERAGEITL